jgi:uncharacterized damage-inducible protein DinB
VKAVERRVDENRHPRLLAPELEQSQTPRLAFVHSVHADRLDPAGIIPARAFTKQEIKAYLEQGRKRTRKVIESLTGETAHARHSFRWGDVGTVELLLYNMRHVQHHTAQLNLLLRQTVDSVPDWVCRAKTDASAMLTP